MTITLNTLDLPADLQWSDEFAWTAPDRSISRSITGALIVQKPGVKVKGRPITLQPEDDKSAWMTRAALDQLYSWATSDAALTLTLRGVARAVEFRYNELAIDAKPVVGYDDTDAADRYLVTLRFMEI